MISLKMAENSCLADNFLRKKLLEIQFSYSAQLIDTTIDNVSQQVELNNYLTRSSIPPINCNIRKNIKNLLLTGATGYLGCNILHQLLRLTAYKITLLIRASNQAEAIQRIQEKFQFYFAIPLEQINSRIFVMVADIEQDCFGLESTQYHCLVERIDSVIHCAALVKHYGEYAQFHSANVQATLNLLEFSKLTHLQDFHYISTASVLNMQYYANIDGLLCTEDAVPQHLEKCHNLYVKKKLHGEHLVVQSRETGLNANIYRVGNLAFIADSFQLQENLEENAFFNWMKCLIEMRCITKEICKVEISPVDHTAKAIVKLFDKSSLSNQIYHVFNPNKLDLADFFTNHAEFNIQILTLPHFIDRIMDCLDKNMLHELIVKFLLHQGWLDKWDVKNTYTPEILQIRTQNILQKLNFQWNNMTENSFYQYLHNYI